MLPLYGKHFTQIPSLQSRLFLICNPICLIVSGHHEDADTQAGCVLAQRGKEKLGIDTLRVVSPKVTTKSETTDSRKRKLSPTLVSESGNPSKVKYVQLNLFDFKEWETG